MKKCILFSFVILMMTFVSCGDSDNDSFDSSAMITVGEESPILTISDSGSNNIECCINSSWLCENYVSVEAKITIEGEENAEDYYTRAVEATATEWGLQITDVDETTGVFYIYLEAPINETYKNLPAILTIVILDANGGETTAMRSIKFGEYVEVAVSGIPQDSEAGETPVITDNTVTLPDFVASSEVNTSGITVMSINLSGVSDNNGGYLELKGTGESAQNVWLEFDNIAKGISVEKVSTSNTAKNDIVFLVDNSGSMSEEANGIAESIQAWATELSSAGIDAQFGCVGYNGSVTGAIDLTDVNTISAYLNEGSGTSRTVGFDTTTLSTAAAESVYKTTSGECAVVALRFATDQFAFRSGSNRIFVNFTDEPNQTGGDSDNSVEYVNNSDWSGKGTIHTVYSSTSCNTSYSNFEDPRLLSDYTGGTSMDVSSDFSGVTLSSLPVSEAIQNTYIIKFTNIESYVGTESAYDVKIVVKDGTVQSSKTSFIWF